MLFKATELGEDEADFAFNSLEIVGDFLRSRFSTELGVGPSQGSSLLPFLMAAIAVLHFNRLHTSTSFLVSISGIEHQRNCACSLG